MNPLLLAVLLSAVNARPDGASPPAPAHVDAAKTPRSKAPGILSSLDAATAWLHTAPLRSADLRGKVVVIDFWTYSCINWRRSSFAPRAWARTYRDAGLVVVGVHSPEFPFEREYDNVAEAAHEAGIDYPVALDNEFAIWRAFGNHYWPAQYVIDAHGRIRYRHFGEGDYQQSEDAIRQVLSENGTLRPGHARIAASGVGVEAAADWANLDSPETYAGFGRSATLDSTGGGRLRLNHWALSANWKRDETAATSTAAHGSIAYRFHARDLHIVMGPLSKKQTIRFRVLLDGMQPGEAHGIDVDERGYGVLKGQRLYQVIRQHGRIIDRDFEIDFLDAGAQVYAFTFG